MSPSLPQILLVVLVVLLLFGAGRLPRVMGDFAKGIKSFRKGLKEEDEGAAASPKEIDAGSSDSAEASVSEKHKSES